MTLTMRWCFLVVVLACPASFAAEAGWEYPVIKGYGKVVARPQAAGQPQAQLRRYRVVFDIATGSMSEGVNEGMAQIARYLNVMGAAGVDPDELRVTAVLHGQATAIVLQNETYFRLLGKPNHNLALLKALNDAGVEIFVCAQALAEKGYYETWVAPPVRVALAAQVVATDLQLQGWAYLPYK